MRGAGARTASDVAVVIPAYNAAGTLARALASIRGQTVRPGRIVVIDDGSHDDTATIANAERDAQNVEVLRLPANVGAGSALRAGIEYLPAADFPWIVRLDADDAWLPEHLAALLAVRDATDAAIVSPDAIRLVPGRGALPGTFRDGVPVPADPAEQRRRILVFDFVFGATLFRRDCYERAGGFRSLRVAEDWDLWLRMIRGGDLVRTVDSPTYVYTVSPSSSSAGRRGLAGRVSMLDLVLDECALTRDERKAVRTARRQAEAEVALWDAYDAGAAGDSRRARRLGLRSLRGSAAIRARGAATTIAPRLVSRARGHRGLT
jgi:GT2 family glycosyltransferase